MKRFIVVCALALALLFGTTAMPAGANASDGCRGDDIVIHWQKNNLTWMTADSGYGFIMNPGNSYFSYGPAWNDWASWNSSAFPYYYADYNIEAGNGVHVGFRLNGISNPTSGVSVWTWYDGAGTQHRCRWSGYQYHYVDGDGHFVWYATLHTYESY